MASTRTGWAPRFAAVFAAVGATGCTSLAPPPELDLTALRLVVDETPTRVEVNGLPGGKVVGAGVGAGTGSGAGVLAGALVCAATGPFFPFCVAAVVPTAAAAGALAGGVVGALRTESSDAMAAKTEALNKHVAAGPYRRALAERVQEALRAAGALQVEIEPATAPRDASTRAPWTLDVSLTEVGTEGKGVFALRLVTRVSLRRTGDVDPVWSIAKQVQSERELSTSAWTADDGRAMQIVLDRCLRQAAHELTVDLARRIDAQAGTPQPRSRYSTSCHDAQIDVAAPAPAPSPMP